MIKERKDSKTNLLIAIRKGTRSCTQHPLQNYMSFGKLSHTYRKFCMKVSIERVSKGIEEALSI